TPGQGAPPGAPRAGRKTGSAVPASRKPSAKVECQRPKDDRIENLAEHPAAVKNCATEVLSRRGGARRAPSLRQPARREDGGGLGRTWNHASFHSEFRGDRAPRCVAPVQFRKPNR